MIKIVQLHAHARDYSGNCGNWDKGRIGTSRSTRTSAAYAGRNKDRSIRAAKLSAINARHSHVVQITWRNKSLHHQDNRGVRRNINGKGFRTGRSHPEVAQVIFGEVGGVVAAKISSSEKLTIARARGFDGKGHASRGAVIGKAVLIEVERDRWINYPG